MIPNDTANRLLCVAIISFSYFLFSQEITPNINKIQFLSHFSNFWIVIGIFNSAMQFDAVDHENAVSLSPEHLFRA